MNWFLPHTGSESRKPAEVNRSARARLSVEPLEDRTVPTAVFDPVFGREPIQTDRHEEVSSPNVVLVFWGNFWGGPNTFLTGPIQDAAQRVLDSDYLSMLTEYGSDGHAHLGFTRDNVHVTSFWVPGTVPDGHFNGVNTFFVARGAVNPPANSLYVVVTPPGVMSDNPKVVGYNGFDTLWVGVNPTANPNPTTIGPAEVDTFSLIFGHELAEAMSDPIGILGHRGVTVGPGDHWVSGGDDQIGDNEGNAYTYREPNGALVQPLWSDAKLAWVATDGNTQAVNLHPIWKGIDQLGFSTKATFSGQYDLTVSGDQLASPDDLILLDTTAGGLLVNLNGELFHFDPGQIRNVTVIPGAGTNSVVIRSMAPGVNYTVNTSNHFASTQTTVDVMPATADLDGVNTQLHVNGGPGPGRTDLNLYDFNHAGGIDYEIDHTGTPHSGVVKRATNNNQHTARGKAVFFDYVSTLTVKAAGLYPDAYTVRDTPAATNLEGSAAGCAVSVKGTTNPLTYKGYSSLDRVVVGDTKFQAATDTMRIDQIKGNVTVSDPGHALDLVVDDGGDPLPQTPAIDAQGLTFGGVRIGGTDLRKFEITLGTAAGTQVNVYATPNTGPVGSTTTYLDSLAAAVTVFAGNGDMQGFRGHLAVQTLLGSTPRVDLTVLDGTDPVRRTATVFNHVLVGLSPAAIYYEQLLLKSFTVFGARGGTEFDVVGTPDNGLGMPTALYGTGKTATDTFVVNGTSGPLQVNGGGGVDFVTVGGFGTLNFLAAPVDVANPTGQTVLNIDDHLSAVGRFGTLGTSSLTFLTAVNAPPAPITWSKANVVSLHVAGGSGGNTFAVNAFVNLPLFTTLNSGAGNDTVRIAGGTGSFYLDGDGGTDLVTVGNGSLTGINGTVYLANAHGHSFVTADDSKSIIDRNYRLLPSPLNLPYPGSLTLTGTNTAVRFNPGEVQAFTVKAGSGFDMMGVLGLDNRVALGFDGGSGKDTVLGPSGDHIWAVTAANGGLIDNLFTFTNTENLIGQTGMDVFKFAPGGSVSGTISGGGGGDWLDYSAVAQGVFVDLPTGKASLVNGGKVGGVSQIRNARGSDVGNVFTGDGQGNIFVGGAGSDLLVGGSGRNVLIGGGGADVIRGGSAGDLLIAGRTSYDDDNAALDAIQAEWLSADSYGQKIAKLYAGVGPGSAVKLQFGVTVFADPVPNLLVGGAGQDWFFASPLDVILNQQAGEAVN